MVTKGILAWGSSSIEGLQAALTLMSDSFGAGYHNGGISGAYANTILAAQGSRPALVGFAGGIRPDSTPQPITVSNVQAIGTIRPLTGTLEGTGVTGTLSWSAATGWQFSRSDGGGVAGEQNPSPGCDLLGRDGLVRLQPQQMAHASHSGVAVVLRVVAQQLVGQQFKAAFGPGSAGHDVGEGAAPVNPELPAVVWWGGHGGRVHGNIPESIADC